MNRNDNRTTETIRSITEKLRSVSDKTLRGLLAAQKLVVTACVRDTGITADYSSESGKVSHARAKARLAFEAIRLDAIQWEISYRADNWMRTDKQLRADVKREHAARGAVAAALGCQWYGSLEHDIAEDANPYKS